MAQFTGLLLFNGFRKKSKSQEGRGTKERKGGMKTLQKRIESYGQKFKKICFLFLV